MTSSQQQPQQPQLPSRLILISGRLGSGKTTLATRLSQFYHMPVMAFADVIRYQVSDLVGVSVEEMKTDPSMKASMRPILQALGQFRREYDGDDYWARELGGMMSLGDDTTNRYIVDDMRFPMELDVMREIYPELIHIHLSTDSENSVKYLIYRGVEEEEADKQVRDISELSQGELYAASGMVISADQIPGHTPAVTDGYILTTALGLLEAREMEKKDDSTDRLS